MVSRASRVSMHKLAKAHRWIPVDVYDYCLASEIEQDASGRPLFLDFGTILHSRLAQPPNFCYPWKFCRFTRNLAAGPRRLVDLKFPDFFGVLYSKKILTIVRDTKAGSSALQTRPHKESCPELGTAGNSESKEVVEFLPSKLDTSYSALVYGIVLLL